MTIEKVAMIWIFLMGALTGVMIGIAWEKPKDITKKLEKVDIVNYEKLEDIRHKNDIINSHISDGTLRLYVRTNSESSSGMDDGQKRTELHAKDAESFFREVPNQCDQIVIEHNALIDWVNAHLKR